MPLIFSYIVPITAKVYALITITIPPKSHEIRATGKSPFVMFSIASALKKTPEPTTIPTTIQIAVTSPYFFFNSAIKIIPLFYFSKKL